MKCKNENKTLLMLITGFESFIILNTIFIFSISFDHIFGFIGKKLISNQNLKHMFFFLQLEHSFTTYTVTYSILEQRLQLQLINCLINGQRHSLSVVK